ncbi:hypothetical protein ETAA8_28090 [Anatilimnocola aggregata]|uniref:Uncharacterized protein n=1 Tax=Anatilimnocola aggregata TaxID=2528021 RepID=A0A517YC16_9BACT|nr:hypothetical protein [Anatilimnocola aggregata]QDU27719.1 hypothetical protein ETAA8_28090 [Anatilimnocola aggregata]
MNEITFPQFAVLAPDNWFDVTAEMDEEDSPSTLAPEEGLGVLQISLADFPAQGEPPAIIEVLRTMLKEFAKAHELGSPNNLLREESPRPLLAGNFIWGDDFLRVWYLTDSGKLAFVTYTCERGAAFASELSEVEQIVRSLKFLPTV